MTGLLALRHAGFGKARHAGVAGERRADDVDGEAGAGAFAEPHAEIEQRRQVERIQQAAVAGLRPRRGRRSRGRARPGPACAAARPPQCRRSRRAAPARSCGGRRASRRGSRRVRGRRARRQPSADRRARRRGASGPLDGRRLALQAGIVDAGAAPDPAGRVAAEQRRRDGGGRRGVADAHLAEAEQVGVARHRVVAGRDGGEEIASSIAGARVKSAVGRSTSSGMTASSAPATRASWLIAAPPAAKFATICAVTSAGKAETPCAVTPCEPAKTMTSTRSRCGMSRPCQRASQATIVSSRPRLPCGLVSMSWRRATAAAARVAAGGRSGRRRAIRRRIEGA